MNTGTARQIRIERQQVGDIIRLSDDLAALVLKDQGVRDGIVAQFHAAAARFGAEEVEVVGPTYHEFGLKVYDPFNPDEPGWTMAWKGYGLRVVPAEEV